MKQRCHVTFVFKEVSPWRLRELALCITLASRHYTVVVRTNLIEDVAKLGIPCDIHGVEWDDSKPWSVYKLRSYQLAPTGEQYIHIDSDVLLIDPLPERVVLAGLFAQSVEPESMYAGMRRLPDSWLKRFTSNPFRAYNCGVFGGDAYNVRRYAEFALTSIEPKLHLNATWVEQAILGMFQVETLFTDGTTPPPGYIHLMGASEDSEIQEKVSRRLILENPLVASRLGCILPKKTKITVSFFTPCFNVGGAEQWIATLCRFLNPDRFTVESVVVPARSSTDHRALSWLPRSVDVRFSAKPDDTDVVITWGFLDLRYKIRDFNGVVIDVQHMANPTSDWQSKLANEAEAALLQRPGKVFLVSVNEICRQFFSGPAKEALIVIPNGVDQSRLHTFESKLETRKRLGLGPEHRIALYVGRIQVEQKNPQAIIDAVEMLGPEWRAVLNGPIQDKLQISSRTIIVPPGAHVGHLMAAADVLAHPARHESHGLSINEAWLAGLPVVSCSYPVNLAFQAKHGPMMELLDYPPPPDELAIALENGANRTPEVIARSEHARKVANEFYTAQVMGRAWSAFIEQSI